jgi:hypothetical protein
MMVWRALAMVLSKERRRDVRSAAICFYRMPQRGRRARREAPEVWRDISFVNTMSSFFDKRCGRGADSAEVGEGEQVDKLVNGFETVS